MNVETPKPRWWTRMLGRPGLLSALAVCLLLSALLGPFAWRYYRTRQLVAGIEAQGGHVVYDPGGPQWVRDIVGDEWMKPFHVPAEIQSPGFNRLIGGSGLVTIVNNREDADFFARVVALNNIHGIRTLVILGNELNDHRLEQLSRFEHLEFLSISGPQFDDDALADVSKISTLRTLMLHATSVTDEGLRHLHMLNSLKMLELSDTKVTAKGISDLERHLPKLIVSECE